MYKLCLKNFLKYIIYKEIRKSLCNSLTKSMLIFRKSKANLSRTKDITKLNEPPVGKLLLEKMLVKDC